LQLGPAESDCRFLVKRRCTMSSPDEMLRSLREAVRVSPRNVPLRQHVARTLVTLGRFADAEAEFRDLLRRG
jgi:transitional endoplasmic reticulum ATPase